MYSIFAKANGVSNSALRILTCGAYLPDNVEVGICAPSACTGSVSKHALGSKYHGKYTTNLSVTTNDDYPN